MNRENSTGKNFGGALLVDKPVGPTSHDVVALARRALGERGIGHTGTLDPLAEGLLVLLVGRATRLASLLTGAQKTYEATVRLGVATNTFDAAGEPQPASGATAPASIDDAAVADACEALRHQRQQVPPAFSAKKIDGVRAYALARRSEAPEMKPVDVTVHALDWRRDGAETVRVTLTVSAGYYVRAMAHDLGQRLRCGAHLAALRRTAVGPFNVVDAVPLDVLTRETREAARARVRPMEALLPDLPAVTLTDAGERRARHGNTLGSEHVARWDDRPRAALSPPRYRVLTGEGQLIAVAEASPAGLRPFLVLAPAE